MKSTPLLFKAEMVRAILAGTKTQTRRLVKPQPGDVHFEELPNTDPVTGWQIPGKSYRWSDDDATGRVWTPPLGQPGDLIWVRETFAADGAFGVDGKILYRADFADGKNPTGLNWKPSIFMPRKASRITLELTAVRVERLNEISCEDAEAEGITAADYYTPHVTGMLKGRQQETPVDGYQRLWEHINGPGSWAENPWVWVYEFKPIKP